MHERLYSEGNRPLSTKEPPSTRSASPTSSLLHCLTLLDSSTEAITASLSTLSVDAQKRAEKDAKKKEAKAAAAESREKEAREQAMVYIKRVERNKRKYVTAVSGLEAHGMDLKKVAKEFG